jgi:hypothetical protein
MARAGMYTLKKDAGEARQLALAQQNRAKALQHEEDAKRSMALNGLVGASTAEMRTELAERGVPPMSEEQLAEFAQRFDRTVDAIHPGKDRVGIWFKLFREVDDDHSG